MSKSFDRDIVFKGRKGFALRRQTGTATAGAVTKHGKRVQVTTAALTTAAAAVYSLTLTNSEVKADSMVIATVKYGTCTAGVPVVTRVTPADGSVVVAVQNNHASAAFDGTLVIDVLVVPNAPTP